jgi:cell division protease FtsH
MSDHSTNGRPQAPDRGQGLEFRSRERDEQRATRRAIALWDRLKFLVLFAGMFGLLLFSAMEKSAGEAFATVFTRTAINHAWLLVLIWLEIGRQLHYLASESIPAYHRFWRDRVFGVLESRAERMGPWQRYRLNRLVALVVVLAATSLAVSSVTGDPPATALLSLPGRLASVPIEVVLIIGLVLMVGLSAIIPMWIVSQGGYQVYFPDEVATRFEDVWGQDKVLEKVKESLVFLEHPDEIEQRGGFVPSGILFWGPPGTGKTLIAEAVAGETGKPYVFVDPGAFTSVFRGGGILKVKALFRKIRKLAVRYGGVVAFFDEADALGNRGYVVSRGAWTGHARTSPWSTNPLCNGLGYMSPGTSSMLLRSSLTSSVDPSEEAPKRSLRDRMQGGSRDGDSGTLQALLAEISGLKKPRGFMNRVVRRSLGMRPKPPPKYRLLIMMATNVPQALDEALLRPGRIDRIYKVGYPSKSGRIRTYRGYLDKVRHDLTEEDVEKLAKMTPYATGATMKDLVNEALITTMRDGRDVITWEDIVRAKHLRELGPPEEVEYVERERHAVAVHEACHAVVAYRVRHHLVIDIATIEKGGNYLGMVASIPPEDQFVQWRSEYEADILTTLASLAGERLFFDGDNSSGVGGDLESATKIATLMEGYWGMGTTVASHGVTHEQGIAGGAPGKGKGHGPDSKDIMETGLGHRIEGRLAQLLEQAEALVRENRREILAVAHALESNKTLTGADVEAIVEGREGPLVDGSVYDRPEFAGMLEAYHAHLLAAHKRQSTDKVPLPSLNGSTAGSTPGALGSAEDL